MQHEAVAHDLHPCPVAQHRLHALEEFRAEARQLRNLLRQGLVQLGAKIGDLHLGVPVALLGAVQKVLQRAKLVVQLAHLDAEGRDLLLFLQRQRLGFRQLRLGQLPQRRFAIEIVCTRKDLFRKLLTCRLGRGQQGQRFGRLLAQFLERERRRIELRRAFRQLLTQRRRSGSLQSAGLLGSAQAFGQFDRCRQRLVELVLQGRFGLG